MFIELTVTEDRNDALPILVKVDAIIGIEMIPHPVRPETKYCSEVHLIGGTTVTVIGEPKEIIHLIAKAREASSAPSFRAKTMVDSWEHLVFDGHKLPYPDGDGPDE